MQNTWKQNTEAATDQWDWEIADRTYGHITQYTGSDRYCWQAVRGDFRLAGTAVGRDASISQAEEIMALPIDEFNRRVTVELIDQLRKTERDILRLSPSAEILPGYHAGYEAGVADIRRRITAAIDLGDEGHNVEVTGAARLYRAASVWTAGLGAVLRHGPASRNGTKVGADDTALSGRVSALRCRWLPSKNAKREQNNSCASDEGEVGTYCQDMEDVTANLQ
jgi:hypothetical protein